VTPPLFPLKFDMDLLQTKCVPLQVGAEKSGNTFLFNGPRLPNESCFLEGPRTSPFFLLVRATCRWRWAWSTDCMMLTGKNWSTGRKSYLIATFLLQIRYGLSWDRTRTSTVRCWRVTAWAWFLTLNVFN